MSRTISSSYSSGITLTNAGDDPVLVTGTIDASTGNALFGVTPVAWSITNQGTIETGDAALSGISLAAGGSIGNAAGALISGYYGVAITGGPGVVLNAGTVESTAPNGVAVAFSGGYDNRLIDDPGAVFVGAVRGGNKVGAPSVTTLELASGAATGTLAGLGTQFVGFGQVTVDAGAHWAWTSSSTVEANATLTNSGTLGGRVNLGAGVSLVNDGTMHTTAGPVAYGSATDTDVSITNVGLMSNSSGTSSAIALKGGGFVSNASSGSIISGGHPGVYIGGAIGTVLNQGSIFATGTTSSPGIALDAGGYVSNASSGTVSSKYSAGVYINGGAGTVVNAGLIETSDTHTAVVFETGGTITNQSGGTIIGTQHHGIYITGASGGTVVNDGSILGMGTDTGSSGIVLESGGFVSNSSDGLISSESHVAIYAIGGGVTVLNTGKIVGGTGHTGVYLKGVIDTVQNSGSITGGGNGIALENGGVVSNSSAGFIYGTNNSSVYMTVNAGLVVNAGKIQSGAKNGVFLGHGGTVENLAGGTIMGTTGVGFGVQPGTVANAGLIDGSGGAAVFFSTGVANELIVDPGAQFIGNVNGGNLIGDAVVSTLDLASGSSAGTLNNIGDKYNNFGEINFDNGAAWLISGNQGGLAGTISGFARNDTVQVTGITATGSSFSNGVLTLTGSGSITTATLDFAGNFSFSDFDVTTAGGNTDVALNEVCFLAGTRVATPRGEVPVEQLAVGDTVTTLSGEARPITWIGTGRVLAPRGGRVASAAVIVRKGALADNVPHRDLRVTKGHSLFIDGVLIPVEFLINHHSILWDAQAGEVTIYHIELQTHDVLIADGAPAESYRDDGNRWLFQNANSGWKHPPKEPCARVLTSGPVVDLVWRRLRDRAHTRPSQVLTREPDLHLLVDGKRIDPLDRSDARYVFQLGGRPRTVRICSRAAAPQALGVSRDPRVLGVAIRRFVLAQARRQRAIDAAESSLTDGYHAFESADGIRWTTGDAALPMALFAGVHGPCMLTLQLGGTTQYPHGAVAAVRAA